MTGSRGDGMKEKQVAVTTQHSLTYLVKGAARTHTEGECFKGDSRRADEVCKAHHGQHHQMWHTNQLVMPQEVGNLQGCSSPGHKSSAEERRKRSDCK